MKRLILLRHAKAVSKKAGPDRDRVLAEEGRREMEFVARHVAEAGIRPDLVLVSPAARTRETWSLSGLEDAAVRYDGSIYDAPADTLLGLVRSADRSVETLMMVGHNPGFEELAAELVQAGPEREVDAVRQGLPTAALVAIEFDVEDWRGVSPRTGRLVGFFAPPRER